jgi:hypothetical protein
MQAPVPKVTLTSENESPAGVLDLHGRSKLSEQREVLQQNRDGLSLHRVTECSRGQSNGVHEVTVRTCRPRIAHGHRLKELWR